MTTRFDAITLQVLWTRLISVVDEAAKAIVRTSFSTLSNEANDFACVLTDTRGYALAQNTGSIPSFIGTLPATVRHFRRELGPDAMRPGDVLITNDPWKGTGHMSDVSLVRPIFHRVGDGDRLVAFSATTTNSGNVFASGTVSISDNDSGAALYNVSGQTPTSTAVTSCIKASPGL